MNQDSREPATNSGSPRSDPNTQDVMNHETDSLEMPQQVNRHATHERPEHQHPGNAARNAPGLIQTISGYLVGDHGQASRRLQEATERIVSLQQQLAVEHRNNRQLNVDLNELHKTNVQMDTDLREFQIKSFREMGKDSWTPMEDRIVREKLTEIHKDIEDWVEENCVESFRDVVVEDLTEEEEENLMNFLQRFTYIEEEKDSLSYQLSRWEARSMDPVLIQTAIITHMMYIFIFRNPFMALDGLVDLEQAESVSSSMTVTYQMLSSCKHLLFFLWSPSQLMICLVNRKQAHRWRSQLMRILFPKPISGGKFDGLEPVDENVTNHLRWKCEMAVRELENSPYVAFLKKEWSDEYREQMVEFWFQATEIFTQLQTQLPRASWPDVTQNQYAGLGFNEQYAEAHRSQAFGDDYRGKRIEVIISPFVSLWGNEDGEQYDKERVVSKAVVLIL